MDVNAIMIALVSGLLGAGGFAAIWRAIGQNRIEAAAQRAHASATVAELLVKQAEQFAKEQADFRGELIERVETLQAEQRATEANYNALVKENARLAAQVTTCEGKIEVLTQRLTAALLERDGLQKQLDEAKRHIVALEWEIDRLKKERRVSE